MFIWFLLFALPVIVLGATLAVDMMLAITASREVSNAAEAAATAGAQQYDGAGTWRLDPAESARAVERSLDNAVAVGAIRKSDISEVTSRVEPTPGGSGETVVVDVNYRVQGLSFIRLASLIFLSDEDRNESFADMTMQRSADVCIPGDHASTDGACQRPQGR
jgi:hypothetical protein